MNTAPLNLLVFLFNAEGEPFLRVTFDVRDLGLRNSTLQVLHDCLKQGRYSSDAASWEFIRKNRPWIQGFSSEPNELQLPSHYIKVTKNGWEEIKPS